MCSHHDNVLLGHIDNKGYPAVVLLNCGLYDDTWSTARTALRPEIGTGFSPLLFWALNRMYARRDLFISIL